jgi:hypothetical protein
MNARSLITVFCCCILLTTDAWAQPAMMTREGEVLAAPVCGKLINDSTVSIHGSIATMAQIVESGESLTHTLNFALKPGEETEICSKGPFYDGQRLDLTIRTLIPLFNCRTRIDRDIYLRMEEEQDGTKTYSATCF